MTDLAGKHCVPCRGGEQPLTAAQITPLLKQVPGWRTVEDHHLTRTFKFPDFKQALAFVDRIGAIADAEDHHPDIYLTYGEVRVEIWTHKIDGMTESDFVLAAKFSDAFEKEPSARRG